ncbi:hypothetical protein V6N12_063355 [Hibiscus sabdariffa]|uniref:Protein FAR1-RELATED SEQUENCE n=1 Tax=Hibiscus sabdariffa TaxID=183260 RepID=A0ABR2FBL4_9ROSI
MDENTSATSKSHLCRRLEFAEVAPLTETMDKHISEQDKGSGEIDSYTDFATSVHSNFSDEIIPRVGMEFNTEQDVYEFYNKYASTRIKDKRDDDVKYHRPETRFGCLAVLKVSRFNGKFRVTDFIAEHTHTLASHSKRMFLRSQRKINLAQVAELEIADRSGLAAKESVGFLARKVAKHLSDVLERFSSFTKDFSSCVYDHDEEEEFLNAWDQMLVKYNLENNSWLQKQFELREKWALVYGRQTFCAYMSTTQRSESMNNQIKMYIGYNYDLLRFFHHFERLLDDRRYEELKANYKDNQSKPSLPYPVEVLKHAADVYTLTVFKDFSKEIWLTWDCEMHTIESIARASMSEQSFDIAMGDGEKTLSKVETTLKQLSIEESLNTCDGEKCQVDANNEKRVKGIKCKPRKKGGGSSIRLKSALEKATRKRNRRNNKSLEALRDEQVRI